MSQILVGDDLHRSFGPTQALRGASIVLEEGEIVAVMGPSGSGKSTLLTWTWPDAGVFAMVGIGVLAATLLSALALPLLNTATRYNAVRFE